MKANKKKGMVRFRKSQLPVDIPAGSLEARFLFVSRFLPQNKMPTGATERLDGWVHVLVALNKLSRVYDGTVVFFVRLSPTQNHESSQHRRRLRLVAYAKCERKSMIRCFAVLSARSVFLFCFRGKVESEPLESCRILLCIRTYTQDTPEEGNALCKAKVWSATEERKCAERANMFW